MKGSSQRVRRQVVVQVVNHMVGQTLQERNPPVRVRDEERAIPALPEWAEDRSVILDETRWVQWTERLISLADWFERNERPT